ncbi:GlsB/YeaQ/YmgE family stress response membrane protein [Candidatus Uhrbacteria bacterium]|nr:GlsB/YeaQ/YmgE family stress response membrane protein [Candidatus Uhrbacteria bacterium]
MSILAFILIGIVAGWLAGLIMRGHGFGLVGDLIIGVVGAVIGGLIFDLVGLSAYGFAGSLAMATLGAVVLLGIAGMLRHA